MSAATVAPVWIAGTWREATASSIFNPQNPATGATLPAAYPTSTWADCDAALDAAVAAAHVLRSVPGAAIASFLEGYAAAIEADVDAIVAMANAETGLPVKPRLQDVEIPRTTTQLRQAAAAAREGSWQAAVLDTKANIRSHFAPIGPVVVFGPNNFPFAFNGISGGDFAAAIATGCPVIAKAHPLHPGTSKLLAECASRALAASGLPPATVQMLYNVSNEDGLRLVGDFRLGASSFTGSRNSTAVARFTEASVAWADSTTETSSSNAEAWLNSPRGSGVAAAKRSKISAMRNRLVGDSLAGRGLAAMPCLSDVSAASPSPLGGARDPRWTDLISWTRSSPPTAPSPARASSS